jgi:hypothetical protein
MTEQQWLTEKSNPQWLIAQPLSKGTRTKAAKRKLLLFAVGCCRLMGDLLWDDRLRAAIEVAELYADGQADDEDRSAAALSVRSLSAGPYLPDWPAAVRATVGRLVYNVVINRPADAAYAMTCMPIQLGGLALPDGRTGDALLCDLVREAFGNFVNPSVAEKHWARWNDRTLPRMAQEIYEEKAWDRLPVLADALEDAGCPDAAILAHLRSPGPHFRGCWAVDLLMGKK